jgi:acyl carrier protein
MDTMVQPARCLICDQATATLDHEGHCPNCAQLLRWFRSYFADVKKLDLATINHQTQFVRDLGCDCLDYVDWVLQAESVFNVSLPDKDLEKIQTVGQFLARLRIAGATWSPESDIKILKTGWWTRSWVPVNHPPQNK